MCIRDSLSGVDTIQSRSMENVSLVIIQYDYGKDIDEAYDDLKKKMDALEGDLPDDCNAPVIMEMNIDEMDTMSLSVNNKAQSDLYNYVNNKIVPEFEKITTVTDVSISGGQKEYIPVSYTHLCGKSFWQHGKWSAWCKHQNL